MLSFLTRPPSRTQTAHLTTLPLDNGTSTATFVTSTAADYHGFPIVNRLPPRSSTHRPSSLAPPLHRHLRQTETFHVLRGTALFTLGIGQRRATAGEVVTVPARLAHTFCNASEGEEGEELVVEFGLRPAAVGDEAYFRNVWCYRDDCRRVGVQRSRFQALLFMHHGGVVMALPGPEVLATALGVLLNYLGGVLVGRFLLGYKGSYPEYYHEASS